MIELCPLTAYSVFARYAAERYGLRGLTLRLSALLQLGPPSLPSRAALPRSHPVPTTTHVLLARQSLFLHLAEAPCRTCGAAPPSSPALGLISAHRYAP